MPLRVSSRPRVLARDTAWEGTAVPSAWVAEASECLFASLYEVFVWRERQNRIWWRLSSDCRAYICGGATRNPYVLVFQDRVHMFGRRRLISTLSPKAARIAHR